MNRDNIDNEARGDWTGVTSLPQEPQVPQNNQQNACTVLRQNIWARARKVTTVREEWACLANETRRDPRLRGLVFICNRDENKD